MAPAARLVLVLLEPAVAPHHLRSIQARSQATDRPVIQLKLAPAGQADQALPPVSEQPAEMEVCLVAEVAVAEVV